MSMAYLRKDRMLKNMEQMPIDSDSNQTDEETRLISKPSTSQDAEVPEVKKKYPKSVFLIIGNEFCERFSFYGMRTVLVLFLKQILLYGDDTATVIFHVFVMGSYFTPLFGAIIADTWLGKYRTILYISFIYAAGNIALSAGAFPQELTIMNALTMVGLTLIALGTGGIKPCVSAFGGDQFEHGQERQLQRFFSFFYLAINLGSLFSTYLTPILRSDVHCFGQHTCFPLAFGIPGVLMLLSVIIFICGKSLYKIYPPQGNILLKVFQCISHAISTKCKSKEKTKNHWLEYADDRFDKSFIADVRTVLHVLLLFLPLPIFWALFDQQSSRWTLQATRLNGKIFNHEIKPDQMQVVNPLFVIIFIPLFEYVLYPLFNKCGFLKKPLQRITIGGLLAALSFIVAGFLELGVEETIAAKMSNMYSETTIINDSPCDININGSFIAMNSNFTWEKIPLGEEHKLFIQGCPEMKDRHEYNLTSFYNIQTMTIQGSREDLNVEISGILHNKTVESISLLYQLPQYILITAGEIMFSITGLEFSYSQAPGNMKSVLQAAWLLTVAFGNLIVVIIAEAKIFEKQSYEFFMFATLMGADMLLFAVIAYFYKYVGTQHNEDKPALLETKKSVPQTNSAYDEDTHF